MKIVFFGNTKYSLIGAKIIHRELGLSCIITIPNSPVQIFAIEQKIPSITTNKLDKVILERIKKMNPDFFVVEDYGLILPNELLSVPKFASLNIHHSLLPKYRGPSPAPSAILAGEKKSGVTIIQMTKDVDAGDIYGQTEYALKLDETTDSLLTQLNSLGAVLLISVIKDIGSGKAKLTKQNEKAATFTNYMQKSDGFFEVKHPPTKEKLDCMIRAYYPWPGVWTQLRLSSAGQAKIVKFLPDKQIQVEGKKPMSYKDFVNGYPKADSILINFLQK